MKRTFDLVVSALGLLVLLPFFVIIGVLVKLADGGPMFYTQLRVGRDGRLFKIWKFRSMRTGAEKLGPAITVGGDARITSLGRFLRRSKVDELPQLWNVLRGEMSMVGPRPEVEKYAKLYTEETRSVLQLKPGITGLASFGFYNESSLLSHAADPEKYYAEVLLPEKARISIEYGKKENLLFDIIIIVATLLKPFGLKMDMFSLLKVNPPGFG
jgi:lipopolysaccharide/colanic/teichoic acid biosynthesis glycosyltransferase